MRPRDVAIALAACIQLRRPVLLVGPPGVSKTDLVRQAAEAAGAHLILSHPVIADPTDMKGLPWAEPGAEYASWLPFGDQYKARKATDLTVWGLDDLGQAPQATQASFMQPLLSHEINGVRLPDCVTFIAATNRRTDRAGVTGILEPVKSRFLTIINVEANLDDWCRWAFAHDMPPELIAFLRFRPALLCDFQPTADMTNSPIPRTWANVGAILKMGLPPDIQHEMIVGAVGEGAALQLATFLRMYKLLPNLDAIILDPDSAPIPEEPAVRSATVTGLGMRANINNFGRLCRYAQRMWDAGGGDFAALLILDSARREPAVISTPDFVKLVSSELGQLISGEIAA